MEVTVKSTEGDQIKTVTRRHKGKETANGGKESQRERVREQTGSDGGRWKAATLGLPFEALSSVTSNVRDTIVSQVTT